MWALTEGNIESALMDECIGRRIVQWFSNFSFFSGKTVFEASESRVGDKRKREKPGDPGDIEGYKGTV